MKEINKILKEVVATQAIEGISVTEKTKSILIDCLSGKTTFDQAREDAIKQFNSSALKNKQ